MSKNPIAGLAIALVLIAALTVTGTPLRPTVQASSLLSQGQPASASSIEGAGYEASRAVDGNTTSTRWASRDPATGAEWIYVDLGTTATIDQVKLYWEAAYAKSFQIQTSNDASAWSTIYSTTTGTGGTQTLSVSGSGRYVRVYCTVRGTSYGYSLWEFQVYGTTGSEPTNTPVPPTNTPVPPTATPGGVTMAQDDWESAGWSGGTGWSAAWTHSGESAVTTSGTAHGGSYHLRLRSSTGLASRPVNLAGASNARLQFWWKANSFESGENAQVIVNDGTNHVVWQVNDGQDNDVYNYADLDLSAYNMIANFVVQFDANMSGTGDYFYVDDLKIVAGGVVPPTNTPVPPTSTPVPPTNTPAPPTDTPVGPTNTPIPPTHTPVPPTNTPIPPTHTPVPPTNTPIPPTVTPVSGLLSRNKPAFASTIEGTGYEASKAVDGNTSTRWASQDPATGTEWIYVDLQASATINRVVLNWEAAYAKAYQVQVSDDASVWSTLYSTTSGNGGIDDLTVSGNGRYVRVYCTTRGTSYGYSLWEFEVYGNTGPAPTNTPVPPTNTPGPPTNTPVPPTVTPTPSAGQMKWAGVRSSGYGISPFPSASAWAYAMNTMASYWSGSIPIGVWLVGEVDFGTTGMAMEFPDPDPGRNWDPKISFSSTDKHEPYLSYFDTHGQKVFLQLEPGFANMNDLIDAVLLQYGDHPSVIGFGVDVEWYRNATDGGTNAKCTDALAQTWETRVKSFNSSYRLFVKHFDRTNLPPTYRGDIIFIDDSEQNGSYANFLDEMIDFADFFYPADVMYQIGYPSDKSWWSKLASPIPQTIGNELAARSQQEDIGIVWVDFSLNDVMPSNWPEAY